jgi:hypothetical protein
MNNDTLIDAKAISELVNTAIHFNNMCIVSGKVYHYDEPNKLQYIGSRIKNRKTLEFEKVGHNEIDQGQYDQVIELDLLDDIFWLVPAQLYIDIGGYSKYFWFNGESADYALNAKKLNYKLISTPKAKLWHKGSISIGGRENNPRLVYWHVQSILILKYLHLKKKYFIQIYYFQFQDIIVGYIKSIIKLFLGRKSNIQVIHAKLFGFIYFNIWIITNSENTGKTPFK